ARGRAAVRTRGDTKAVFLVPGPGDGSITSGVSKKSRHSGHAAGILNDCLRGNGKEPGDSSGSTRTPVKDSGPVPGSNRRISAGFSILSVPPMSEVTRILSAIEQGDPHAAEQLLPLVYDELRQLAAHRLVREAPGQTLQATALVHEAYLRLVDVKPLQHWN